MTQGLGPEPQRNAVQAVNESPFRMCERETMMRSRADHVRYLRRSYTKYCCGQRMLMFRAVYMTGSKARDASNWFSCPCCFNTYHLVWM